MGIAGKARELLALWREPLLRQPVLIIESDDWGPGPSEDADALNDLVETLARYRDGRGRPAVMTLGIVLGVADTDRIGKENGAFYHSKPLSAPDFEPIMAAIRRGIAAGVFSAQLHGMEHYWPTALMAAAKADPSVRDWLMQKGVPRHEDLPSALQSRWVDASKLPGRPLPGDRVAQSAADEANAFRTLFAADPEVVVPPTFLWTEEVEAAWHRAGVKVVVTPGRRYGNRDFQGRLVANSGPLHNGDVSTTGVMYLVRDDYFEPALGHRAARALNAFEDKARLARPALFETHRFNFTSLASRRDASLREIASLLEVALARFPSLRFMTTAELASAIRHADPDLVETRLLPRVGTWFKRAFGNRIWARTSPAFQ